jgi:16S rRNA processing protein RimM
MIRCEDLKIIGRFGKPHGIRGEIAFTSTDRSFEGSDCPFFICRLDGIFVPFRIEACRFISSTGGLARLKNLNSGDTVRSLSNHEIYFPQNRLASVASGNSFSWRRLVGFTLIDELAGTVGHISGIDESTPNTLFIIEKEAEELLIPAAREMIVRIDDDRLELHVSLPDGLLSLP